MFLFINSLDMAVIYALISHLNNSSNDVSGFKRFSENVFTNVMFDKQFVWFRATSHIQLRLTSEVTNHFCGACFAVKCLGTVLVDKTIIDFLNIIRSLPITFKNDSILTSRINTFCYLKYSFLSERKILDSIFLREFRI